jgi:hypothetical protein
VVWASSALPQHQRQTRCWPQAPIAGDTHQFNGADHANPDFNPFLPPETQTSATSARINYCIAYPSSGDCHAPLRRLKTITSFARFQGRSNDRGWP